MKEETITIGRKDALAIIPVLMYAHDSGCVAPIEAAIRRFMEAVGTSVEEIEKIAEACMKAADDRATDGAERDND